MSKRAIFCANDQHMVDHEITQDSYSGDIVATCNCGRVLKFPANVTNSQFDKLLSEHKTANLGHQVVAPGSIGQPDVYEAPPTLPTPEQRAAIVASEGSGPRAQDNLTDAEKMAWEQMNRAT